MCSYAQKLLNRLALLTFAQLTNRSPSRLYLRSRQGKLRALHKQKSNIGYNCFANIGTHLTCVKGRSWPLSRYGRIFAG